MGGFESPRLGLLCAYVHSGITITALAAEMKLTVARVSQLIARAEEEIVSPSLAIDTVPLNRIKDLD